MIRRAWIAYVSVMGAISLAYLFGPRVLNAGPVFNFIGGSAIVAILVGSRLNRTRSRAAWRLLALGQALFVGGDVIAYNYERFFHRPLPFPSIADLLYLAVYPSLVGGLMILIRKRTPGRDRASLIDSVIIAVGAATISWVFLMAPYAHDASMTLLRRLISMAYPLMDVLLLAVTVRLAMGSGRKEPAFHLLTAGVAALLATDSIYGWILLHGSYSPGSLLDGGWIIFYLLWGAAALHPSMRTLEDPANARPAEVGRHRLVVLAAASLLVPAAQIIHGVGGDNGDGIVLGASSAVLFVLVLIRVNGLMVDVGEHRRTEQLLRETERKLVQDIDEKQRSEVRLRQALDAEMEATRRLRELDAMKNSFLQAVSHDLRTPLTTILGVALTLERDEGSISPDDARDLLRRVGKNARRLHRLLTDLLDVERLSQGVIEPNREEVDLHEVASAFAEDEALSSHELIVRGEHVRASVDRVKVERILDNLVANAVRYTPPGTRIWIDVRDEPDGVLIAVEDEGPGVPPDLRHTIFEPFRQGREVVAHSPGVGIGLSLVARFAAIHGGRVWVEDRLGGGASFKVYLPREPAPAGLDALASPLAEAGTVA